MVRYRPDDIARLGPSAQEQIRLAGLARTMQEGLKAQRANKFGAKGYHDAEGRWHDSKGEGGRWEDLKIMQRAGLISSLIHQPRFDLEINGVKICEYHADAEYLTADGVRVVEDFKGVVTPIYRIKRALMAALHGITITEVRKS